MIPSTTRRSSPNGWPRRPVFDGSSGAINAHCASVNRRVRESRTKVTHPESRVNHEPYGRHALASIKQPPESSVSLLLEV